MSPNLISKFGTWLQASFVVTPKANKEGDTGKERKRKASSRFHIDIKVVLVTFWKIGSLFNDYRVNLNYKQASKIC